MHLRKSVRSEGPRPESSELLAPQVVDALVEGYVAWREESASASESYKSFSRASGRDRSAAYAAYLAALDREEAAARGYRLLIEAAQAA